MEKFLPILKKNKLFRGVEEQELVEMLSCLDARTERYKKGEHVFREGEHLTRIAVLLEGEIHIIRDDYWGNRTIINRIEIGEMLGESYIAPESGEFPNDAIATKDSTVVFFDTNRIMTVCSSACRFHSNVIRNLFYAISEKNRTLMQKLWYISRRSTREKLISYLSDEARMHGSPSFTIPFNRQQLADFLSVDRSAMSTELCKMRDEGLIEFDKSRFKLL